MPSEKLLQGHTSQPFPDSLPDLSVQKYEAVGHSHSTHYTLCEVVTAFCELC